MPCLCIPRDPEHQTSFHWPNFSFSHSQQAINPRRVHSTFSLTHKHKPKRLLRRRHTLHNGTTVSNLWKRKKSHRSLKSTRTAPPTVVNAYDMNNKQYAPPPGPPPSFRAQNGTSGIAQVQSGPHISWQPAATRNSEQASTDPFPNAHIGMSQNQPPSNSDPPPAYQPPSGPPPNWQDKKVPLSEEEYVPPPGPPPSQRQSNEPEPPPYDPWLAVPDNALLPPPPTIREERSPTANASWDDAARAHEWCRQHPLWTPRRHNQQTLSRIVNGDIRLTAPPNTKHIHLTQPGLGKTRIRTSPKCTDTVFLSEIPLYTATNQCPRTIYYELRILSMGNHRNSGADAGIAIGFLAPPYPSWRLPGWHRASLAVHGDDGRRYIDNSFGGQDFTSSFRRNDVVGLGMTFTPPTYAGAKNGCEVFFTRNGKREGGWNLHEERDREQYDGVVFGLEGEHDLLAAVGCFGGVEVEVRMRREEWMFKPD